MGNDGTRQNGNGVVRRPEWHADGCLADLTWVVKSNIAVAGWPMCAGSRLIEGYQPAEDATEVVLTVLGLWQCRVVGEAVEPVVGIENVVTEIIERVTVKLISPATGNDVDYST